SPILVETPWSSAWTRTLAGGAAVSAAGNAAALSDIRPAVAEPIHTGIGPARANSAALTTADAGVGQDTGRTGAIVSAWDGATNDCTGRALTTTDRWVGVRSDCAVPSPGLAPGETPV